MEEGGGDEVRFISSSDIHQSFALRSFPHTLSKTYLYFHYSMVCIGAI